MPTAITLSSSRPTCTNPLVQSSGGREMRRVGRRGCAHGRRGRGSAVQDHGAARAARAGVCTLHARLHRKASARQPGAEAGVLSRPSGTPLGDRGKRQLANTKGMARPAPLPPPTAAPGDTTPRSSRYGMHARLGNCGGDWALLQTRAGGRVKQPPACLATPASRQCTPCTCRNPGPRPQR